MKIIKKHEYYTDKGDFWNTTEIQFFNIILDHRIENVVILLLILIIIYISDTYSTGKSKTI